MIQFFSSSFPHLMSQTLNGHCYTLMSHFALLSCSRLHLRIIVAISSPTHTCIQSFKFNSCRNSVNVLPPSIRLLFTFLFTLQSCINERSIWHDPLVAPFTSMALLQLLKTSAVCAQDFSYLCGPT